MKPKFRAWDTENNCFFKPTYEHYKGKLEEIVLSMSGCINIRNMSHTLEHESNLPSRFILNQFTGLKDKNGKEIYEGDILYIGEGLRHQSVRWVEWMAGFAMAISETSGTTGIPKDCEVVGNIYEILEITT